MQKESDVPSEQAVSAQAFSTVVKNQALKILCDYSLTTGHKWQAILNEIFRVTGAEPTERAPIMTRQDLESWASRKSKLGDEKFRWVYAFLTHPDTLMRPEFAKAKDLLDHGVIERVGGAFEDFFGDHTMSGYIRRIPLGEYVDEETIERRMTGHEGRFTGSDTTRDYCLSLERYPNHNFFICHFFSWPISGFGESFDWDIERYSGFCTIGNQIRLNVKGVIVATARDIYAVPKVDHDSDRIDTVNLLLHSLIFQATENVVFDKFETAHRKLKYIDPLAHTLILNRTDDSQLSEFIEQFRWNVVL